MIVLNFLLYHLATGAFAAEVKAATLLAPGKNRSPKYPNAYVPSVRATLPLMLLVS